MPRNPVTIHQRHELRRPELRQGGFHKMPVATDIRRRRGIEMREIASPATGNQDFFPRLIRVVNDHNTRPALRRDTCSHQARRASADHDHIGAKLTH